MKFPVWTKPIFLLAVTAIGFNVNAQDQEGQTLVHSRDWTGIVSVTPGPLPIYQKPTAIFTKVAHVERLLFASTNCVRLMETPKITDLVYIAKTRNTKTGEETNLTIKATEISFFLRNVKTNWVKLETIRGNTYGHDAKEGAFSLAKDKTSFRGRSYEVINNYNCDNLWFEGQSLDGRSRPVVSDDITKMIHPGLYQASLGPINSIVWMKKTSGLSESQALSSTYVAELLKSVEDARKESEKEKTEAGVYQAARQRSAEEDQKSIAYFQYNMAPGMTSTCGMIVEVKDQVVLVQTAENARWIQRNKLKPTNLTYYANKLCDY